MTSRPGPKNQGLLRPRETTHTNKHPTRSSSTPYANFNHRRSRNHRHTRKKSAAEKSTMDFAATDAPLYFVNVSIDHRTPLGSKRCNPLPSILSSVPFASMFRSTLAFLSLVRRVVTASKRRGSDAHFGRMNLAEKAKIPAVSLEQLGTN